MIDTFNPLVSMPRIKNTKVKAHIQKNVKTGRNDTNQVDMLFPRSIQRCIAEFGNCDTQILNINHSCKKISSNSIKTYQAFGTIQPLNMV